MTTSTPSTLGREEITKKAIEKAVENGWYWDERKIKKAELMWPFRNEIKLWFGDDKTCDMEIPYTMFYFSHDFAKAFWGEDPAVCSNCGAPVEKTIELEWCDCDTRFTHALNNWQYCLQKMVLEEDPISYLERFITTSEKGQP